MARSPEGGRAYWRTSRIIVGGTETARARQKRSEKERKTAERSYERQKGRKRESSRTGKEGTKGRKGKERRTGRRTKKAPSTDEGRRWELKGETDDDAEVRRFSP